MTEGAADARIGSEIGGYRIEALLGEGAMGTVYRATGEDGTQVAVKLLKQELASDQTFMERFRLEARIARTVRSPRVVRVLGAGEHEGCAYLAQQFIDGSSLEQTLKRVRRLDVPTTVAICSQVADGLDAMWAAKMVHRDVKPGNILLDRRGNAYLTDFGLSKDTEGGLLTQPGQTLGTLDYMAPEQIRAEPVGPAADVYALGCVVFECLHGRPPFGGRQGMRLMWAQLQEEPPDPSPGGAVLPPKFVEAVKSALRKPAADRPASAGEYARLLSTAAGVTVAAAPVNRPETRGHCSGGARAAEMTVAGPQRRS